MKNFLVLALPALASSASIAASLQARQSGYDILGVSWKKALTQAYSVKKLPSEYGNGAIREQVIWGPFKLNPANGTHDSTGSALRLDPNSDAISTRVSGLCTNCMVLRAQSEITSESGARQDVSSGVYSHHVLVTALGHPMVLMPITVTCPNGMPGGFYFGGTAMASSPKSHGTGMSGSGHSKRQLPLSVLVGQGDDGTPMTYMEKNSTFKSGFYIAKTDVLNIMTEVINYNAVEKEVYVMLDYDYLPDMPVRPKDYLDVGMGAINVEPCGVQQFHPAADKPVKYTSPPWDVYADGYLLDIKPHMHDGAVNMTFYVSGRVACSSQAIYGTTGSTMVGGEKWETIGAYSRCPDPVKIRKGDKLTMEAWYDLTKHRLRPSSQNSNEEAEGMAIALFTFARPPV